MSAHRKTKKVGELIGDPNEGKNYPQPRLQNFIRRPKRRKELPATTLAKLHTETQKKERTTRNHARKTSYGDPKEGKNYPQPRSQNFMRRPKRRKELPATTLAKLHAETQKKERTTRNHACKTSYGDPNEGKTQKKERTSCGDPQPTLAKLHAETQKKERTTRNHACKTSYGDPKEGKNYPQPRLQNFIRRPKRRKELPATTLAKLHTETQKKERTTRNHARKTSYGDSKEGKNYPQPRLQNFIRRPKRRKELPATTLAKLHAETQKKERTTRNHACKTSYGDPKEGKNYPQPRSQNFIRRPKRRKELPAKLQNVWIRGNKFYSTTKMKPNKAKVSDLHGRGSIIFAFSSVLAEFVCSNHSVVHIMQ
ncbi:hypothetical protein RRG08_064000 [Elysia crispata]|uniref:Uncharacterized protein n=1 Tax=Elysia crispata TaxID=231223 RepID=A0AAE1CXA6_9GAST|nr:hypothetical protein RRG08_064000 [Elysia crispata]